ncbi:MAG: gliding motility-associated C-terminal domain-containing protein [Bacteroidota bacterium]
MMRSFLLFLLLFFVLPQVVMATHNRAGEIVVEYAGDCGGDMAPNRVCATIITYTEFPSDAYRDSLTISWGDGTEATARLTAFIDEFEPGIRRNEYTLCHDYDGPGQYNISFSDPNRVGGIENVNPPNSIRIPFSVFNIYTLTDPNTFGCNSSPVLDASPLTRACVGEIWSHNPGAFDPDGDSLSFEFTVPRISRDSLVPRYSLPNEVGGNNGDLSIDPVTGQIIWDTPNLRGEFNLAFLVVSWRNGIAIDTMIRDMQIFVEDCVNDPPIILKDVEEICVVAGDFIEFTVTATAPLEDEDQLVSLRASGGPFLVNDSPATFTPVGDTLYAPDPVTRIFRWQTTCEHISNQPYFVVFRAEDNFFNGTSGLSTIQTVTIRVLAPPPEDLQIEADDESVTISWEKPYACDSLDGTLAFLGFSVWRREGSNNFEVDTCITGLEGRGYTQLEPDRIMEMQDGRFVFFDEDVDRGRTYCYRVLAQFGRRNGLGFFYERLESIPSEEVCVQLPRDIPLLTKVDVSSTSSTNGTIDVCWIRPDVVALDTSINQGPYRYVLSRADGQTDQAAAFSFLAEFVAQNFGDPIDTCFIDTGLDTEGQSYSYRIELFVDGESMPVGEAQPASSVRLSGAPTDEAIQLSWAELVPWTNTEYDVFRRNPGSSTYDSITTVVEASYLDEGLINGEEYCYFIRSVGTYNVDGIPTPILNRSQELCLVPFDNVAPCPPVLTVSSLCDRGEDCNTTDDIANRLSWQAPIDVCGDDDVAGYRIYYSPTQGGENTQVGEVQDPELLEFDHTPPDGIVGCYFVTAYDANNNESMLSNEVCVVNCPLYELPNAFTPNGDGQNELFVPRVNCFIERVEMEIFNRWGQVVHQTEDPQINWDGTNLSGQRLASGTYYYSCQIFERRLEGVVARPQPLSGYIELLTNE